MSGQSIGRFVNCSSLDLSTIAADEAELQLAASVDVPVLISGPPAMCREIACELDRRSCSPRGSIEVVDCRQKDAVAALRWRTRRTTNGCDTTRAKILLLQEVHALSPDDQAFLARQLKEARYGRSKDAVRILASSSISLFERVVDQLFDESLFYRLNVIHIIVPSDRCCPQRPLRD